MHNIMQGTNVISATLAWLLVKDVRTVMREVRRDWSDLTRKLH